MQGTIHKTVTQWLVIYGETSETGRIHHKQAQLNPADLTNPNLRNGAHVDFKIEEILDESLGKRIEVATLINL
jgi:hypothetical protein